MATTSTPWTERICPSRSFPRSPTPIMPTRMRSLAPSTREVGYASTPAVPIAACFKKVRLLSVIGVLEDVDSTMRGLQRVRLFQKLLHSLPTLACRFFGRAGASPVSLQADSIMVAVALERFELSQPVDHASA